MSEDMVYDACLEVRPDGACVAQLCDLPACFARAAGETEALAALETGILAYFDWLSGHDEYTPIVRGPFRVIASETLRSPGTSSGAFFQADAAPMTADDLDWYTAVLDWSYQDVADALAEADAQDRLDVPTFTAADEDTHFPAIALCEHQAWLLSRFELSAADAGLTLPKVAELEMVAYVHDAVLKRVRAATDDERRRIVEHAGERWSLRKVLRRSILLVREGMGDLD